MKIKVLSSFSCCDPADNSETVKNVLVLSDGSSIENTDESIKRHNEQTAKAMEKAHAEFNQRQQEIKTGKLCPVDALYSVHDCQKDCALFRNAGCSMKHREPEKDTSGMPCPFMRKCSNQCALYEKGCTL